MIKRTATAALVAGLALVAMAGCGPGATKTSAATSTSSSGSTSTSTSPSTTATTGGPAGTTRTTVGATTSTSRGSTTTTGVVRSGTIQLTESDDGMSVAVAKGSTLVVVLRSTYWGFPNAPNPAVLQQKGGVTITPIPPCVPGGGCGTASATYTAVGTGQATISASRTSCGEAMGCVGNAGSYSVRIVVMAA